MKQQLLHILKALAMYLNVLITIQWPGEKLVDLTRERPSLNHIGRSGVAAVLEEWWS